MHAPTPNKNSSCCRETANHTYLFAVLNGNLLLMLVCFDAVKVNIW